MKSRVTYNRSKVGSSTTRLLVAVLRAPRILAALATLACAPLAQAADYYNRPAATDSQKEGGGSSSISGSGSSTGWSTTQGGGRAIAGITAAASTYHIYTTFYCRSSTSSYETPSSSTIVVEDGVLWFIFGKQSSNTTTLNNVSVGNGATVHYFNNGDSNNGVLAGSFQMASDATLQISGRYANNNGRGMTLAASVAGSGAIVACRYDNDNNYVNNTVAHLITGDISNFTGDLIIYDYGTCNTLSLELVNAASIPANPAQNATAKVVVTNSATLKVDQNWVSPANRSWDFGSSGKPTIYVADGKVVTILGSVTGSVGFTKTGAGTLVLGGDTSGLSGDITVSEGEVLTQVVDTLSITSTLADCGSPSPAYGTINGLAEGAQIVVSCGVTPWTNATETIEYVCTGWKLYDLSGTLKSSGAETSFTYTHPTPAAARCLEWQWELSKVKGTVTAGNAGTVSPSGTTWYSTNTPVTVTATPDAGYPFVFWSGILPLGIDANVASVTFTPSAPFEMTAIFTSDFYVATTGNDDNSGTKTAPFATIGAAVTAANAVIAGGSPSATVFVADGNYTLSGEISVDAPIAIVGESGNRDAVIVTAKANSRAFTLSHAAATLSGITVLGGGGSVTQAGGNIYIDNNGGIVTNCVVANGRGYHGGNIAMGNPSPSVIAAASSLVVDCVVSNGTDTAAAGSWDAAGNIYSNGGRILRCVIADGFTQNGNGGGNVRIKDSIMENCLITGGSGGNAGASIGSGVGVSGSSSRIVNCTFVGNRPPDGTSKLAVRIGSTGPKVVNCVIYGNGSGGQDVENDYKSCFINCAFSSDGANCADTVSPVTNLTDAAFKNYAKGDYRPVAGGVLFNAGDTEAYTTYGAISATDLDGATRIGKKGIDIGCYEAAPNAGLSIFVR